MRGRFSCAPDETRTSSTHAAHDRGVLEKLQVVVHSAQVEYLKTKRLLLVQPASAEFQISSRFCSLHSPVIYPPTKIFFDVDSSLAY
jgi:hypothetical protein